MRKVLFGLLVLIIAFLIFILFLSKDIWIYSELFRKKLKEPIEFSLNNRIVKANLLIENTFVSTIGNDTYYNYCGKFNFTFLSSFENDKKFFLVKDNIKVEIYPDSIAASDIFYVWSIKSIVLNKEITDNVCISLREINTDLRNFQLLLLDFDNNFYLINNN